MGRTIEGVFDAKGLKAALVASRFNEFIVGGLISGAQDALIRQGMDSEAIIIIRVPGAFEIPQATSMAVRSNNYDMVIALGAVIRGATPHFDYVASEVAKGVALVAMEAKIPVGFGVLTTDTIEQAIERAGSKAGNKGAESAMAALEMADVLRKIEG